MYAQPSRKKSGGSLAHFVISAGGSRALLAGCGSAFACHLARLDWKSIGGVSGGSIPAALLASGKTPAELLKIALEVDFREKCVQTAGKWETMLALLFKEYHEHPENRTSYGVMETTKLGEFLDELVPTWPEKFWTLAVDGDSIIVFKKDGIFEYDKDGKCTKLSNDPGKVGFAIQATCAIPGITKPPKLGNRLLFDGAYSKYGMCPVGVPIEHFGVDPCEIVGMSVGSDMKTGLAYMLREAWKWLWRVSPDTSWGKHSEGVLDIHPYVNHIHGLRFELSADEKWLAVLDGFASTIHELAAAGTLKGERLHEALELLAELPKLTRETLAPIGKPQLLASRAEKCFKDYGLL